MQAKSSPAASRRRELVAALNLAAREASGLGVMLSEAVGRRLGVNTTDLECLGLIELKGSVTAGDIAAATGLTSGAVTGVIDRLERAGFARRERDATDRRKVHVTLVPEAAARARGHYRAFGTAIDRLADRYSDADLALITDYFRRSSDIAVREIARLNAAATPAAPARSPRRAAAAERKA